MVATELRTSVMHAMTVGDAIGRSTLLPPSVNKLRPASRAQLAE